MKETNKFEPALSEPPLFKQENEASQRSGKDLLFDIGPFEILRQLFGEDFPAAVETNRSAALANIEKAGIAIEENNQEVLERSMHSLKSSSRQFGAVKLGNIAEKMEHLAKDNKIQEVDKLFSEMLKIHEETTTIINQEME